MTSLARVPCTIVTGFLGAGKTTLIRHVLATVRHRRLAILVNEFGEHRLYRQWHPTTLCALRNSRPCARLVRRRRHAPVGVAQRP